MIYLLDTNICIYVINEQPAHVLQRLIQVGRESLVISTVTVAELAFGAEKSQRSGSGAKLENFLSKLAESAKTIEEYNGVAYFF